MCLYCKATIRLLLRYTQRYVYLLYTRGVAYIHQVWKEEVEGGGEDRSCSSFLLLLSLLLLLLVLLGTCVVCCCVCLHWLTRIYCQTARRLHCRINTRTTCPSSGGRRYCRVRLSVAQRPPRSPYSTSSTHCIFWRHLRNPRAV